MKILMVDDDPDDRHLSQIAFRRLKADGSLDFVSSGQELIDHLNSVGDRGLPDLILLDINMPGKNGFETLTEIRADPGLKHLKIKIFSTSDSVADMTKAKERGADGYLVKPSDLNQLVETFREINKQSDQPI